MPGPSAPGGQDLATRTRSSRKAQPSPAVLITLTAGPQTLREIEDAFRGFGRRLPHDPRPRLPSRPGARLQEALAAALAAAAGRGWVIQDGDRFSLTGTGRMQAGRALGDARGRRDRVHRLLQAPRAARWTMIAQLAVTAVKVPAALISGSVAQLNDAFEEVLDVVGSAVVWLGVRSGRERLANIAVVVIMAATGMFAALLTGWRFFVPLTPTLAWYPLTVAAASVPFYLIRSAYERAAGLRGGSVALISQSVDSRNHAIVALGVVAGLLSTLLRITVLDTLIGTGVALVILKNTADLATDLIRSMRGGADPGPGRYSLWVTDRLGRLIQARIQMWLLYLVEHDHLDNRDDLLRRAGRAADPDANLLLREFGPEASDSQKAGAALAALLEQGWLTGGDHLAVTRAGRKHLKHALRRRW